MYERFGYSVYRRVKGYYHTSSSGNRDEDEDAYGMMQGMLSNGRYEKSHETGQVKAEC